MLLQTICYRAIRPEQTAFAETGLENHASRRGLEKAGFRMNGRLRQTAFAGFLVSCRLEKVSE
jgi:RimJ/RimL family protein N-acetyltransferase